MSEIVLEFKNICYSYKSGNQEIIILENASCSFEKGKLYTIVGPSGSGKTTTLTLAGALEQPQSGEILFKGKNIKDIGYTSYRNSCVSIVFQAYNLLEYMNPIQNVMTAMEITSNRIDNKKQREEDLLIRMGLSKDQIHRNVKKLSGGEQQRVAIARALSTDAEIILADEPTGNLDSDTAKDIVEIFKELARKDGKCVIAVTHSEAFANESDIVIKLEDHRLK
ncbi:MAG: ABC transporter ATP-binding protein [Clostridia bacterium]|nr:ABC transporter ATP-binding protein [Clostridia bacterium]